MIESPVVLLPQPDSPTSPTHSPASTLNETPSTARDVRVAEVELGLQVLDFEDGAHGDHPGNGLRPRAPPITCVWRARYGIGPCPNLPASPPNSARPRSRRPPRPARRGRS